ncbi:hypothetical protein PFISCL1PPCAC_9255, partial [Pristionchus fissidentatus]
QILSHVIIPTKKGLIGAASACVVADWFGRTSPFPSRPFALTYRESQIHDYFVLNGPCRTLPARAYTAWWIDLRTGDDRTSDQISLVLVRPFGRGGILRLREELRPRHLHDLLRELRNENSHDYRLLLPKVQLHSQAEMLNKWRLSGVEVSALRSSPHSTRPISPPFVSAMHGATIRIDEKGVSCTVDGEEKPHTRLPHSFSPLEGSLDRSVDPNFHFRFDAPFLFFLVHVQTLVPVIAGCYAGAPATSSLMLRRTLTHSQSSVRVKEKTEKKKEKKSKVSRIVKSITDKISKLKKSDDAIFRAKKKKRTTKSRIDGEATQSTTTSTEEGNGSFQDLKWREKLRSLRSENDSSAKSASRKSKKSSKQSVKK